MQISSSSRLPRISAALAATCAGVGLLVVQKQKWDQESQLKIDAHEAELRRVRMEAEAAAAAEAAKAAEAEAIAQANAAREDAERAEKAAKAAKEAQDAEDKARRMLEQKRAELAAVAEQCSQLLADLKLVVEGSEYAEARLDTQDLSDFLQQAQVFVDGEAFKSLRESPLDGMAELTAQCAHDLSAAKDQLAKLSKADAAEKQYEAAAAEMRAERQSWLLSGDVDASTLASALSRAQDALSELRTCGLEGFDIDDGQVVAARSVLSQFECAQQKQQSWEQHRQALHSAVTGDDALACEHALQEARAATCPPSAAMAIAEEMQSLPKPKRLPEMTAGPVQNVVDDCMASATATNSFLSRSELLDQASSLAHSLAIQYMLDKQELAYSWQSLLPEWERQTTEKMARLSNDFAGQKTHQKLKDIQDFQETASERRAEAIRDAMSEVQDQTDKDIYSLQSERMQELWAELSQIRHELDDQVQGLGRTPEHLQKLWSSDRSPDTQAESVSCSAVNLLALREGCREQLRKSNDSFANKVISHVTEELHALGKDAASIPTEQELQRHFHEQLPQLVAAAFEPRTGLASEIVGRIFGMMYMLKGEQDEASMHAALESRLGTIPSVASVEDDGIQKHSQKHNLRTLALATELVDNGRLAEAVDTLDGSLSGLCRSRADYWMSLARMSLLLHQASEALLARSMCLNAGLSD